MSRRASQVAATVIAALLLMSFRLDSSAGRNEALLYDVRGAFVAARGEISHPLVTETDRLVNEAIFATVRSITLPRAVLTVRIERVARVPVVFGQKAEATVTVEAVAVGNGEVIAAGNFGVSAYSMRSGAIDGLLADRIAERVSREFRLGGERRTTLATALFPGR
ncbi:hypothetical protein LH464_06260 [Neorhizobium sp. T786]|uniref:hypothetical protein n=1 Tax=Pseudorhizobium xiangyangii TaxID=2883104 RepID=UPI001CFFABFC|nr:hypothetical protein [Neorhizobium xiangyangii]MCB5202078.1 hypothetical protein [Neorhizobium xiangyangii]